MDLVKSPLYYAGNKYTLLHLLKKYFPIDINNFFDLFGGSGVVSLNMIDSSNHVFYNEKDNNIFKLFETALDDKLWNQQITDELVKSYNIVAKDDYINFRNDVVNKPHLKYSFWQLVLYIQFFSFSNQINFNNNNKFSQSYGYGFNFNSGYGDRSFKSGNGMNEGKITTRLIFKQKDMSKLTLKNYDAIDILKKIDFKQNDFIYLDPPYTNTYGYSSDWNLEDDEKLFNELDKLTEQGIKWGLSNVFEHNGITNQHIIDWVNMRGYSVFNIDKRYTLGSNNEIYDRNAITKEVYIYNYKSPQAIQLTFDDLF